MNGLSERLELIASFVPDGAVLADVGTDHALIPVKLLSEKRIRYAYAMDVNRGPLARAGEHLKAYGLTEVSETRLSDGLTALSPGEADTVLIAGLGGDLMLRILSEGLSKRNDDGRGFRDTVKCWILSPHTEWAAVRRFLKSGGFRLVREEMAEEDGKYYLVLKAVPDEGGDPAYRAAASAGFTEEEAFSYGPLLLTARGRTFLSFLERERRQLTEVLSAMPPADVSAGAEKNKRLEGRKEELRMRLLMNRHASEGGCS